MTEAEVQSAPSGAPVGAPLYTKDELQIALLRAGLTPRDLKEILPCNVATLYKYLHTGESRRLNVFAFENVYDFLHAAITERVLPAPKGRAGTADKRQLLVKRAFNHWFFAEKSFKGFDSAA